MREKVDQEKEGGKQENEYSSLKIGFKEKGYPVFSR
jgi:hypothetical protein